MSCRIDYIEEQFRESNPTLADSLNDTFAAVRDKVLESKLFKPANDGTGRYLFAEESKNITAYNAQQEFVSTTNKSYEAEVIENYNGAVRINVLNLPEAQKELGVSTLAIKQGVDELFQDQSFANQVYEALGFEIPTTKLEGKKFDYGEPTFFDIVDELASGDRSELPSSILIKKLLNGKFLPTIKNSQIILGLSEAGIWRPNLKKIEASGENKSTLAKKVGHELLHSVTNNIILSYQNLKGVVDFNDKYYKDFIKQGYIKPVNLSNSQIEALDNLVRIRNKVVAYVEQNKDKIQKQDRGFGTYDYFIRTNYTESETDLHEFVSEIFTNPELINILKEIPSEGKKSNLFKDFIEAISKILGFTNTSILEDIVAYSEEAFFTQPQITSQQKQQALQLYSQYLDTIFPDSKVKDIVYHGTDAKFDTFRIPERSFSEYNEELKRMAPIKGKGAAYFTDKKSLAAQSGKSKQAQNIISAIINLKNPKETKTQVGIDDSILDLRKNFDGYVYKNEKANYVIQAVFESEQIHILGSKQDIEGFKQYVENVSSTAVMISGKDAFEIDAMLDEDTRAKLAYLRGTNTLTIEC